MGLTFWRFIKTVKDPFPFTARLDYFNVIELTEAVSCGAFSVTIIEPWFLYREFS